MGWFTVPPNDWLVGRFFLWMKKRWHSLTSSNRVWSVWTFDMFDASTVIKCYKSTSVWAQIPSSGQTDFSRAFEGWLHPFVHDTCLVSSLRSICWILRCGSLECAQYHAGDLVIAWETALFVFVQTSSAHCFGKHLGGMPVSSMSKSSGKKNWWLHF